MSTAHKTTSPLAANTKTLLILLLKVLGVGLAFSFRIIAMILNKLSELLDKATGNGRNH